MEETEEHRQIQTQNRFRDRDRNKDRYQDGKTTKIIIFLSDCANNIFNFLQIHDINHGNILDLYKFAMHLFLRIDTCMKNKFFGLFFLVLVHV